MLELFSTHNIMLACTNITRDQKEKRWCTLQSIMQPSAVFKSKYAKCLELFHYYLQGHVVHLSLE